MQEQKWNEVLKFLKENEKRFVEDFNLNAMIKNNLPLEIIELILKMRNTICCDQFLFQAIINRCNNDTVKTMELLKKYGIKFDDEYAASALYDFIKEESFEEAIFLIDNGADVHWNDNAIISMAVSEADKDEDYYEILKALFNAKTY